MIGAIFTYLLTAVGVACGLFSPFIGLMTYYLFAILRPSELWFWSLNETTRFSLYVAVPTIIGWLVRGMGDMSGLRHVALPVAGLAVYLACGAFTWQATAINSDYAFDWLIVQLKIGAMCLLTLGLVTEPKQIKAFAWVVLFGLGYLAWVFNEQYLQGWNRVLFRGFGGIDNNGVALTMVMGVPLAFFVGLGATRWRWFVRGACLLMALLMVHVVLFSFSRGGQLGLCMVGAALFIVALISLPQKGLILLLGLVAFLVTLRLAGYEVRQEFLSIFVDRTELDASAASRFETWGAAWQCILDHPLGVGPRNFNLISHHYGLERGKSVHNLFLQTGADYGVVGALGLALFYFGSLWTSFRITRDPVARELRWPAHFGAAACISLAGFLVCSMFVGIESVETGYIMAMLGLCTSAYVRRMSVAERSALQGVGEADLDVPELAQVPNVGSEPR